MNDWDKDQFISAPITSRVQTGWVGQKPGRYKSVLGSQGQALASKGYSWKNIRDILKAGLEGGTMKGTPIHSMFIQPVKDIRKIPQIVRKLKMGTQEYSTPPIQRQQNIQVKQAKIKEQNMTYQEVCNALRGEQLKKEASVHKLASYISMVKKADADVDYFNQTNQAAGDVLRGAGMYAKGLGKTVWNNLGQQGQAIGDIARQGGRALMNNARNIAGWGAYNAKQTGRLAGQTAQALGDAAVNTGKNIAGQARYNLRQQGRAVADIGSNLYNAGKNYLSAGAQEYANAAKGGADTVKQLGRAAYNNASATVSNYGGQLAGGVDAIREYGRAKLNDVNTAWRGAKNRIGGWLSSLGGGLRNSARK